MLLIVFISAWDQSQKFVKFYVTLKNVQTLPPENISCKFTNRSLELNVVNLDNKDYLFILNNLLMNINPEESTWKVKSGNKDICFKQQFILALTF